MFEADKKRSADIVVQGGVAIAAGVIFFLVLFLPWFSTDYTAIIGLTRGEDQISVVIPLTLILLAVITIFGGIIHIGGYEVGIRLATITSAVAFFVSVMVIVFTLVTASDSDFGLYQLVGPWIGAAGGIFGVISSKLERKL